MTLMQWSLNAAGVLGFVLGVINTFRLFRKDRVRVRVRVSGFVAFPLGTLVEGMSVEVVNLSEFPVTVTDVNPLKRDGQQLFFLRLPLPRSDPLPRRLEPRDRMTICFPEPVFEGVDLSDYYCIRVETACGAVIKAGRKNMRQFASSREKQESTSK